MLWIQTYTGKKFYPLAPRVKDIDIQDIAHALSLICRFTGHCREFYSVAEHCIRVSKLCRPDTQLLALLHDASEAYLSDVSGPLKRSPYFREYRSFEANLQALILRRFGISASLGQQRCVKHADAVLLATEARDLLTAPPEPWGQFLPHPFPSTIRPLSAKLAESLFLATFTDYGG